MMTTTSAGLPIVLSMSSKSKLVAAPASCSRTAKVKRVATIRLLLKFQVTLHLRGSTRVFAEIATRSGAPVPRPARQPALLVERKNHVNGGVHFDGIAIEKSRLIAPLAGQWGIHRLNTVDDACCLDVAANAERTSQLGLRWGRRSAHATDDAAKH